MMLQCWRLTTSVKFAGLLVGSSTSGLVLGRVKASSVKFGSRSSSSICIDSGAGATAASGCPVATATADSTSGCPKSTGWVPEAVPGALISLSPSGLCMAPSLGAEAGTLLFFKSETGPRGNVPHRPGITSQVFLSASERNGGRIPKTRNLIKLRKEF